MIVDIEGGKYTYIFEDGRARLLRYGEPSRRDVVGDKLIYRMAAEIAELRQQLGAKDVEIARLKTVPMKYRRMAFNAQLQDENAQLSQQVTLLREKFQELANNFVWNGDDHSYQHWVIEVSQAALAATDDLSGYILCEREPECWYDKHGMITHDPFEGVSPLYRTREK